MRAFLLIKLPFSPQKHQPQNITLLRNSSSVGENLWHASDFKIISFLLYPARQQKIEEIIEQEPLSADHIEELSPYSNQYVIPHNQTNTKRYGLILYSKQHRQGAEEEADNFKQALETSTPLVRSVQFFSDNNDVGDVGIWFIIIWSNTIL